MARSLTTSEAVTIVVLVPFYFLLPYVVASVALGFWPEWGRRTFLEALGNANTFQIEMLLIFHWYLGFVTVALLTWITVRLTHGGAGQTWFLIRVTGLLIASYALPTMILWVFSGFWFPLRGDVFHIQFALFISIAILWLAAQLCLSGGSKQSGGTCHG